jgi:methylenetetrahydrofolate--tRNA-(uracil-5-)-methyltransferase
MNVNFGLFPPLAGRVKRRERKPAHSRRALADLDGWLGTTRAAAE